MNKLKTFLLVALFTLGFIVRLYRFDSSIADWHSWRQADTSSVSRNFVDNGFDLLHPRFDDISNVPTNKYDNPNGYRFVEFPIYNVLQAVGFKYLGVFTLEEWGRLVSIIGSLFSAFFIYKIISKRFNFIAGFWSALFFLFIPFNIYYSRTILPDPLMVTASLGSIYFFQNWILQKKTKLLEKNLIISIIFSISALLLKPYAIFFILPILYLAYEKFDKKILSNKAVWSFVILSVIPLFMWRYWMLQYPEGIPQSNWLFNGNHIRFRPSFFYWIVYERFFKLILGFFGLPIFILSFVKNIDKNLFFAISFLFSSGVYMVTLATGNVTHDYYQILIIPSIAIFLGLGASNWLSFKIVNKYLLLVVLIILTSASFLVSGQYVKDYFNINEISIVHAGQAVDRLTPKNAKVIANYNGDTSFLYQTKRKGWASFEKSVPELMQMGATYLILINPTAKDLEIGKTYKIIEANKEYVIFDLLQKP